MSVAAALVLCVTPLVHDGDTLRCGREKIRIENIDAPELPGSPKCKDGRNANAWCDYELGFQSRDALADLLSSGKVYFIRTGTDPYGRTLARVYAEKIDAGRYLIARRLARPWR